MVCCRSGGRVDEGRFALGVFVGRYKKGWDHHYEEVVGSNLPEHGYLVPGGQGRGVPYKEVNHSR